MRFTKLVLLVVAVMFLFGCATYANGPVQAPLVPEMKGPVAGFDNDVSASKVGKAKAQGILIFGMGDASIKTAAANGDISKIHHVDNKIMNILGLYSEYTTVVYGE